MQSSTNTGQNRDKFFEQESYKKSEKLFEGKNYCTDLLKQEHATEVIKIFTQSFCDYEPMTHYLGINYDQFMPFAKQLIEKAVHDELSVVILDDKKVIAFANVDDIADTLTVSDDVDPKLKFIFGLLQHLSDFFLKGRVLRQDIYHIYLSRWLILFINDLDYQKKLMQKQ